MTNNIKIDKQKIKKYIICQSISFDSYGTKCHGQIYMSKKIKQDKNNDYPAIVMAPGYGSTSSCLSLIIPAVNFAFAGFITLLFDYRYFGKSQGNPRQKVSIIDQREDYINAIKFLRHYTQVNPERIGIWGTSFSGHVFFIANQDDKIKAVVSLVPLLNFQKSMDLLKSHQSLVSMLYINNFKSDQLVPLIIDSKKHKGSIFMSKNSYKLKNSVKKKIG